VRLINLNPKQRLADKTNINNSMTILAVAIDRQVITTGTVLAIAVAIDMLVSREET